MFAKPALGQHATLLSWSNTDFYSVTGRCWFCLGTSSGSGTVSIPEQNICQQSGWPAEAAGVVSAQCCLPLLRNASSNYCPPEHFSRWASWSCSSISVSLIFVAPNY